MHRIVSLCSPLALALATASSSSAHPGHGVTSAASALHYLAEPLHAAVLVLALAAGVVVAMRVRGGSREQD